MATSEPPKADDHPDDVELSFETLTFNDHGENASGTPRATSEGVAESNQESLLSFNEKESQKSALGSKDSVKESDSTRRKSKKEDDIAYDAEGAYSITAIVIKNIPFNLKREQLLDFLTRNGVPKPYALNYHLDPQSSTFRGMAFANFKNPEEAVSAMNVISKLEILGRKLRAEHKRIAGGVEKKELSKEKSLHSVEEEDDGVPPPSQVVDLIRSLRDDVSKSEVSLPKGLTPEEIQSATKMAERMGLTSLNEGEGADKVTKIVKKSGNVAGSLTNGTHAVHLSTSTSGMSNAINIKASSGSKGSISGSMSRSYGAAKEALASAGSIPHSSGFDAAGSYHYSTSPANASFRAGSLKAGSFKSSSARQDSFGPSRQPVGPDGTRGFKYERSSISGPLFGGGAARPSAGMSILSEGIRRRSLDPMAIPFTNQSVAGAHVPPLGPTSHIDMQTQMAMMMRPDLRAFPAHPPGYGMFPVTTGMYVALPQGSPVLLFHPAAMAASAPAGSQAYGIPAGYAIAPHYAAHPMASPHGHAAAGSQHVAASPHQPGLAYYPSGSASGM